MRYRMLLPVAAVVVAVAAALAGPGPLTPAAGGARRARTCTGLREYRRATRGTSQGESRWRKRRVSRIT